MIECLAHLGLRAIQGSLNCCNSGAFSLRKFISVIESAVGKEAIFSNKRTEANFSPYGIEEDRSINNQKLEMSGFFLEELKKVVEVVRDKIIK
ncbi:MAG: hypothetical protein H6621_04825 [Halobacteriovoraceae bacterium]|nr:hypothetical protein [Halobacteriovoraceae bacterium]